MRPPRTGSTKDDWKTWRRQSLLRGANKAWEARVKEQETNPDLSGTTMIPEGADVD